MDISRRVVLDLRELLTHILRTLVHVVESGKRRPMLSKEERKDGTMDEFVFLKRCWFSSSEAVLRSSFCRIVAHLPREWVPDKSRPTSSL